MQSHSSVHYNCNSCLNHDLVHHLWIGFELEFASLVNVYKSRQQSRPGYSIMIKLQVTIVDDIVSELMTNITNFDAWEALMVIQISQLQ